MLPSQAPQAKSYRLAPLNGRPSGSRGGNRGGDKPSREKTKLILSN
jgi:hypothetical protein